MSKAPRLRNGQELAAALGINVRSLQRYRSRGLELPAEGEAIEAWAPRAKEWIGRARQKTGPKIESGTDAEKLRHWDWRYRRARAEREELNLRIARGEVHSKAECEREQTLRFQDLNAAFAMVPDKLARRLYQAPSPEAIKIVVKNEIRLAFDNLVRGTAAAEPEEQVAVDGVDAQCAPAAERPDGQ